MENKNPKIVDIVSERSWRGYVFKCKKCGTQWKPKLKPFRRNKVVESSWDCPKECKPEDSEEK